MRGDSSTLVYFGRFARHHWLGFFGRFSHYFVRLRNAHDFFNSRFALGDASPAVLPQGLHTFSDGTLLQFAAIAFSHDQLSQRLSNEANFINRGATLVAGLAALIATSAPSEAGTEFLHRKTDLGQIVAWIIHHLDTVGANRAHQPLGNERLHHRREQKRFYVHVEQACDATHGVIRVECAENEVASHGRANCDVRRFNVANLTDHDHIRILSQNVTEAFGESQIDLRFHIDLRDTSNAIFDWFFDGDDAALDGINAAEKAIKRSRFAATRRAGQKNDPVRLRQEMANDLFLLLAQIEALEIELLLAT